MSVYRTIGPLVLIIPGHLKKFGILYYTLKQNICIRVSVHPSFHQCFVSGLYLEHLWTDFIQTLYIRKEWSGIEVGKFCQISTELWPLIYVIISFPGFILSIY